MHVSLSAMRKAGWVKEFSFLVGSTGLSAYQHAEATGPVHPADWLWSTHRGRNRGRTSKRQAGIFKKRSFILSASNYTTPGPSLWCVSVYVTRIPLPSPPLFPPTLRFSCDFSPSLRYHLCLCVSSSPSVSTPSGYHICRLFPLAYISWAFRLELLGGGVTEELL